MNNNNENKSSNLTINTFSSLNSASSISKNKIKSTLTRKNTDETTKGSLNEVINEFMKWVDTLSEHDSDEELRFKYILF
jgi:hypothetical protein